MAKFDYALGYRLLDFTSNEAFRAGTAKGQPNEAQCATAVSAWAFWHGYTDVNILGNGGQRYDVAKKAGYKVGKEVKPWSWICFGTGYYGKYGHVMAIYDVVDDYIYYCEANYNGDGKITEDDMLIVKCKITDLTGRAGYQGCIYLAETFPDVVPKNLDYHYTLDGKKTELNKKVSFSEYKVNYSTGVNYREYPNGRLMGVFANNSIIKFFDNSEKTVNNIEWIKADNGCWCAKKLLVKLENVIEPEISEPENVENNVETVENSEENIIEIEPEVEPEVEQEVKPEVQVDEEIEQIAQTESTVIQGLDLSQAQASVNFNTVKNNGYKFVMLRAGYGNAIAYPNQYDTKFEQFYKDAKSVGLGVGAYWFSYAKSVSAVIEEAKSFIKALQGKQFDYPVYFDLENSFQFNKGVDFCDSLILAFCNELEKAGYYPGVYCSTYWFTKCVSKDVRNKYPVWIAEYNSKCNYKDNYGMWQNGLAYLSGTGNVDHDFCYVNYPNIIKNGGYNGYDVPTPTPTPTPIPVTYKTYYANDKDGVNFRKTPNGELVGTYKYGEAISVIVGSDTTENNVVWVKAKNGYWSAKNLLSETKPVIETYTTMYANDKSGVNYRKTPNGTLVGTYKYAEAVQILDGSETTQDNNVWVKAKNSYWSVKKLFSTTKPKTETYITMYANDLSGVNYRETPNGKLVGTYNYGQAIQILEGSDTNKDGNVWVKSKEGYWSVKKLLTTKNPITYKTYYANNKSGVNYRKTPNGQIMGTYYNGQSVRVIVGSETTAGGIVWVKASNGYWSAKNLLTTTKPKV